MAESTFEHDPGVKTTRQNEDRERGRKREGRPSFSSQKTSDRLRECERRPSILLRPTNIKPQRKSVFKEEQLDDLNTSVHIHRDGEKSQLHDLRIENAKRQKTQVDDTDVVVEGKKSPPGSGGGLFSKRRSRQIATSNTSANAPPVSFTSLPRVALLIMLIAVVVPAFRYGDDSGFAGGADADVIRTAEFVENGSAIEGRQSSPTAVCTRWAQQVANVNGTIYIYGGEATTESGQTTNTWNNNFLTLDLTKSWDITTPSLTGLPQPSGPPAVALGALWNSYDSLFLYGGEFADNPSVSPLPVSTWQYSISAGTWTENLAPQTSVGNNSDGGNQPVQRSAEGAGISVPELGRSWYFGGHLDMYTTEGWSDQIARVYLKSLLEFTHPGYANSGVESLGTTKAAGSTGVYRNITQGGIQDAAGFTERADGVLVYIPGWGEQGILLGLAGGTNESFTEMNNIDIYDIASSTWYKQTTSGSTPPIRVNPCATVAVAPDGTSFNVYLYGGQNLIPYDHQIQYSDIWILTIPSFTWIQVPLDGQSQPPARAGHTCTMWDGQVVVVGGYVGTEISCDSPGIYVFNASSLQWTSSFKALASSTEAQANTQGSSVLEGSVGYQVPAIVQSVIGGSSLGGATVTTPAAGSATSGPLATGRSPVFTVTRGVSTIIQTSLPTSTGSSSTTTSAASKKGTNTGAIAAGVIAGVLACLAAYLAFCTWLYRKQLSMYKNHVAMAQRTAFAGTVTPENGGIWGEAASGRGEKNTGAIMLGPFGTEISRSGNSREGSGPGSATGARSSMGGVSDASGSVKHSSLGVGAGAYASAGYVATGPSRYSRVSEGAEDTEYAGAGGAAGSGGWTPGHSRNNSGALAAPSIGDRSLESQEDLLHGQEPSFFSVVLNPRRTLKVVNLD